MAVLIYRLGVLDTDPTSPHLGHCPLNPCWVRTPWSPINFLFFFFWFQSHACNNNTCSCSLTRNALMWVISLFFRRQETISRRQIHYLLFLCKNQTVWLHYKNKEKLTAELFLDIFLCTRIGSFRHLTFINTVCDMQIGFKNFIIRVLVNTNQNNENLVFLCYNYYIIEAFLPCKYVTFKIRISLSRYVWQSFTHQSFLYKARLYKQIKMS